MIFVIAWCLSHRCYKAHSSRRRAVSPLAASTSAATAASSPSSVSPSRAASAAAGVAAAGLAAATLPGPADGRCTSSSTAELQAWCAGDVRRGLPGRRTDDTLMMDWQTRRCLGPETACSSRLSKARPSRASAANCHSSCASVEPPGVRCCAVPPAASGVQPTPLPCGCRRSSGVCGVQEHHLSLHGAAVITPQSVCDCKN